MCDKLEIKKKVFRSKSFFKIHFFNSYLKNAICTINKDLKKIRVYLEIKWLENS